MKMCFITSCTCVNTRCIMSKPENFQKVTAQWVEAISDEKHRISEGVTSHYHWWAMHLGFWKVHYKQQISSNYYTTSFLCTKTTYQYNLFETQYCYVSTTYSIWKSLQRKQSRQPWAIRTPENMEAERVCIQKSPCWPEFLYLKW